MKLRESMIAWNIKTDQVEVGQWPDRTGWTNKYFGTDGACYVWVQEMEGQEASNYAMAMALKIIVDYQCAPKAVHREMMKIDEYRDAMYWENKPLF